ncbi:de-etiolated protein 1 abo [Musca autumnalis]|uniref:de-etiolated protein 1 abo n=1 Tax=Musca autumnalis TaxID=221902 RepID=UPI003CEF84EB
MFAKNSQNLQHHLWARETNWRFGHHPIAQHSHYYKKNFYKSITPRLTIQNVDKPLAFLRKFTPDGSMLLAFSYEQRALEVYQYQGVGKVAHLLGSQKSECITAADHSLDSLHIRQQLFNALFKKKYTIQLITASWSTRHVLNREFSIFMENGQYVLLVSVAGGSIFPSYQAYQEYPDLFDDADLYDYTFHLVDLRKGCISDTLRMEHDFIVLSHNHSVSVYGRTIAILSTYRQCIDLLELDNEGKIQRLYTVGPYGSNLDRDQILAHQQMANSTLDHTYSVPLSHLKQKILTFLYNRALEAPTVFLRKEKLKFFYKHFGLVERMLILKMQLIDSEHLLLRYEKRQTQMPLEMLEGTVDSISKNFKLYVFYNITEQKVLKILDKNSVTLLLMLRNYCDEFRNVRSLYSWYASSPSNNDFFRSAFDDALKSFAGGIREAADRFNPTLPISAQSFSTSPYLDYSLFNYDDRFISTLERPRLIGMEPIRFRDRITNILKFRVHLEHSSDTWQEYNNPRDLVTFIFHPYEPFFISIQKFISRYVLNFHIYNANTKVKA